MNYKLLILWAATLFAAFIAFDAQSADPATAGDAKKPNILVIFGDDIGRSNISA